MLKMIKSYCFTHITLAVMITIFIINLVLSREYNLLWILLSGGGNIIDYLGESYETVFRDFQIYRLLTYGYSHAAIWHLLANVFGLWYIGSYLEKKIGIGKFICVYHIGLIVPGVFFLFIYPNSFHYGASPAIFACLGILCNLAMRKKISWSEYKSQRGFSYLFCYLVLSNILGLPTLLFHFMGLVTGFLLGFIVKVKE